MSFKPHTIPVNKTTIENIPIIDIERVVESRLL
jgi:hypothetical protein